MGGFPEYPYYDAGGLAGLIRSGEIAASEVRAKAVRRAKAYNAKLNAIVRPMYERVSEAPAEMTQDGPFPGVPFLLKDLQHALGKMRQSNETEVSMSELEIAKGYIPGSIGRIAELHSAYYHNNWGFGLFFEAKVAVELSEFLRRYSESRDGFWTVLADGRVEGSIAIDGYHGQSEGAHLRWFIMSDAFRGKGAGNRLLDTAIAFCRDKGLEKIYLWTFEGLDTARHLYEKKGFRLVEEHMGTQWGTALNEQRFECPLTSPA